MINREQDDASSAAAAGAGASIFMPTIYFIAAIRSIPSCVYDNVLSVWRLDEHMHFHICQYLFFLLCASPSHLVRSPRSVLIY